MDPRAAVGKLREYQLAVPGHYVLELVRAAIAGGATAIHVYNDSDDLELCWDGEPPSAEDLGGLLEHLFDRSDQRLRLLAVAVNTALGTGPRFLDLEVTEAGVEGSVARARWLPTPPDATEESFARAPVERVPASPAMPRPGMRVHLREALSLSVLGEWLRREYAESRILQSRCVALPVPLTLNGAPLEAVGWTAALVEVPLAAPRGMKGTLALLPSGSDSALVFSELGVLLEATALTPPSFDPRATPLPLRMHLDGTELQTNASRSAVLRSEALKQVLGRLWNSGVEALIDRAVRSLDAHGEEDRREVTREALCAVLASACLTHWPEFLGSEAPSQGRAEEPPGVLPWPLLRRLLSAPLVPLASGGWLSLAECSARRGGLAATSERPPPELRPRLTQVVFTPRERPRLAELLAVLLLPDADDLVEGARQGAKRQARFLARREEAPTVPSTRGELLRVPLGSAGPCSEGQPPVLATNLEGLRGELVLRRKALLVPASLRARIYVQGRFLGTEDLQPFPLSVELALEAPGLEPDLDYLHLHRGEQFWRLVAAVRRAVLEALTVAADAVVGRLEGTDARWLWLKTDPSGLEPGELGALVRAVLSEQAQASTPEASRREARAFARAHPWLLGLPAWETTERDRLVSVQELLEVARARAGGVCFGQEPGGARSDGTPVLRVEDSARRALSAWLPEGTRWLDMTPFAPGRVVEDLRALAPEGEDLQRVPWLSVEGAGGRAVAAPSARGAPSLTLVLDGNILDALPLEGALGPVVVVLEDRRLLPREDGRGVDRASTPTDLWDTVRELQAELVRSLALVLLGEPRPPRALREPAGGRDPTIVARLLFGAWAALGAPAKGARQERLEERGALRALLARTPAMLHRAASGRLVPATLTEAVEKTSGGAKLAFVTVLPTDIDDADLWALYLPEEEPRTILRAALGCQLECLDDLLPTLQEKRLRRVSLVALERRPALEAGELAALAGIGALRVSSGEGATFQGVASSPRSGPSVAVVVRQRLVVTLSGDAVPFPVEGVVELPEALLVPGLDALAPEGTEALHALLELALTALTERAVTQLEEGAEPDAKALSLVSAWAVRPPGARLEERAALRARCCRAALWWTPAGKRVALDATLGGTRRPAVVRALEGPWLEPSEDEPPDTPVIFLTDPRLEWALSALSGTFVRDLTEEVQRRQRRRRMALGLGQRVRLPTEAPCAALSGRVEALAPTLGFGELHLAPGEGPLTLDVHTDDRVVRFSFPAPVAMSCALASPELDARHLAAELQGRAVPERLLDAARLLLERSLDDNTALPTWAQAHLRFHALTYRGRRPALRAAELFVDTAGARHSIEALERHAAASPPLQFCTEVPEEPVALPCITVVFTVREASWWCARRKGLDATLRVREALAALRWERSAPLKDITFRASLEPSRFSWRFGPTDDGLEGEVRLRPWDSPSTTVAEWYLGRRPLGSGAVETAWPSLVALEVPSLKANASRTAPEAGPELDQARLAVASLVERALRQQLRPPEGDTPTVAVHDAKSPVGASHPQAAGWLWLPTEGREECVEVWKGGERSVYPALTKKDSAPAPLAGRVLFRRPGLDDASLAKLYRWAGHKLLGALAARPDAGAHFQTASGLDHLVWGALEGVLTGAQLRKVTSRRTLPGSTVTLQDLQRLVANGRPLRVKTTGEKGDPLGLLDAPEARWFQRLEAAGMLQRATPAAPAAPPPVEEAPPAAPAPPTKASLARPPEAPRPLVEDHGAALLRHLEARGLGVTALEEIVLLPGVGAPSATLARYDEDRRRVVLRSDHPTVAALLAGPRPRALALLGAVVLGVLRRETREVTRDVEAAYLRAVLRDAAR